MKTGMVLVLLLAFSLSDAQGHGKYPRAFEAFYVSLNHHGEWVRYDHDLYVWRPAQVFSGWQPYTVGQWVWTVDGWYWESDEPWGWATYHYGRWVNDDYYGWVWIPDLEWAPAWVEWRTGPACLGWTPLGPYSLIHWSFGPHWSYRTVQTHHWVFVDYKDITRHKVHKHLLASHDKRKYYDQTKEIPAGERRTFGPNCGEVERRGKIRVSETRVRKETIESKRTDSGRVSTVPRTTDQGGGRVQSPPIHRVDGERGVSSERTIAQPRTVEADRGRVPSPPMQRSDDKGRIVNRGASEQRTADRNKDHTQVPTTARVENSGRGSTERSQEGRGASTDREGRAAPRVPHQE